MIKSSTFIESASSSCHKAYGRLSLTIVWDKSLCRLTGMAQNCGKQKENIHKGPLSMKKILSPVQEFLHLHTYAGWRNIQMSRYFVLFPFSSLGLQCCPVSEADNPSTGPGSSSHHNSVWAYKGWSRHSFLTNFSNIGKHLAHEEKKVAGIATTPSELRGS